MQISEFSLTSFDQMLGTVDHLLSKVEADPRGDALLSEKIADDMLPLAPQIRFVMQQVVNTLNRLAGASLPLADTNHETVSHARSDIKELREVVRSTTPDAFVADDTPVSFDLPNGMAFELTAAEYVRDWSLPQLYFHVMTTYSIMRKAGIAVGKADYVGYMMRHAKKPA